MGLSAAHAERIYERTRGKDPLFAAVDGAACPTAPPGQLLNFSLLRHNGVFRIGLPVPAHPQFTITAVHDPYGCALVTDPVTGVQTASVYRRPLPGTNLGFLSAVMWDGRETVVPLNKATTFSANLITDLKQQALDATLGHAQAATAPTDAQLTQMVDFELSLNSAQAFDFEAGNLSDNGADGGPYFLTQVPFFPGDQRFSGLESDTRAVRSQRVHAVFEMALLGRSGTPVDRARRGNFQHSRADNHGRSRAKRCFESTGDHRHMHHVSRYA